MDRDHANSVCIGGRNRLNVLIPIEVMVTTATQESRTAVRDGCTISG
jgi:hypothetical protein